MGFFQCRVHSGPIQDPCLDRRDHYTRHNHKFYLPFSVVHRGHPHHEESLVPSLGNSSGRLASQMVGMLPAHACKKKGSHTTQL
ncbi:hypothetical protein HanRHA438_Chr11g0521011 [Helianthus annuus]|uniref:Uncharacterized protein n=1 Tax=Helianthus annuus TaxID=4232 RepID=A0A9K3HS30_HELAN|nr:hypothetical protein HanXRQr2_Chr11g0508561 [Helianthus annuus]KAJ0872197.1 hypothetical protein HanRHA438_Chr11g0521011 [Helianthus annuus]